MALHELPATRENLHGSYSRDYAPALTIVPGDTVRYSTLMSRWVTAPYENGVPGALFEPRCSQRDGGHALTGPIWVRGAKPGMTLAVRVDHLTVGAWGWTAAGGEDNAVTRALGLHDSSATALEWVLDKETLTGRNQYGHTVKLQPFMGQMGMPPAEPGVHPTRPPRCSGGNIDCKELGVGSTLYLPIPVEGALFSVGDGHALQGDGEVAGVAIECPMERVDLTFDLHENMRLTMPRAHTPTAWITFGFHQSLDQAALIALEGMLDLMEELHDMPRDVALGLATAVVDIRITQLVNGGVVGAHAMLPHEAFSIT